MEDLRRNFQIFAMMYGLGIDDFNSILRRPYFHLLPHVSASTSHKDRIKKIKLVLPKIDLREIVLLPLSLLHLYYTFNEPSFIAPFLISSFSYLYLRWGDSEKYHEISHASRELWLSRYRNIKVRKSFGGKITYEKLVKETLSPSFMERIMEIKRILGQPKIILDRVREYPSALIRKAKKAKNMLEDILIIEEAFANYEAGKVRKGKIPQMGELLKYFPPWKKYVKFAESFNSMNSREMKLNTLEKIERKLENFKEEESAKEIIQIELEDLENSLGFKEILEKPPPIIPKYHLIKQLFKTTP